MLSDSPTGEPEDGTMSEGGRETSVLAVSRRLKALGFGVGVADRAGEGGADVIGASITWVSSICCVGETSWPVRGAPFICVDCEGRHHRTYAVRLTS